MSNIPAEHRADSVKLEADAYVELFQVELTNGSVLYLSPRHQVTWQNETYEPIAVHLTGVGNSADDEKHRPKMTIMNVEGIFSAFVAQKTLYNARVIRYRVLREDLEADRNIYQRQTWRVRRPEKLTRSVIVLQLSDQLDGQFFILPARQFIAPEFPTVTL